MNDYDRRILDSSWRNSSKITCDVPVHGNVEVDKGDLLFLDHVDGLRVRGTSSADYHCYPFSKISGSTLTLDSNQTLAYTHFLGVAAWHHELGVTGTLGVYPFGLFRYPLKNARRVKVGYYVVPTGSGVTLFNQKVTVVNSTSIPIGLVAESGEYESEARVRLVSRIIGAGNSML